MLEVATSVLGEDYVIDLPSPLMGAEDWSFILEKVPGAMAFLGARPPGDGPVASNHSNRMVLEESGMSAGIALHAALAMSA
jgi:hippurate hydrolase